MRGLPIELDGRKLVTQRDAGEYIAKLPKEVHDATIWKTLDTSLDQIAGRLMDFPYIYRWDRHGRKGQFCRVLARGKMNSCCVEFEDGYKMITSRNALYRRI